MKHIKLFEAYSSDNDGAQQAAEMKLEDLIGKAFPNHAYNTSSNNSAGDYTLDQDEDGDGTEYVFANVYLTQEKLDEIQAELDEDYDAYVAKLEAMSDDEAEIYNVSTGAGENFVSISIAYKQGYGGRG